jgi:hypothetical protein
MEGGADEEERRESTALVKDLRGRSVGVESGSEEGVRSKGRGRGEGQLPVERGPGDGSFRSSASVLVFVKGCLQGREPCSLSEGARGIMNLEAECSERGGMGATTRGSAGSKHLF